MEKRQCKTCGKEYPLTDEYFHKHKTCSGGLRALCKKCRNEREKTYKTIVDVVRTDEYKEKRIELENTGYRKCEICKWIKPLKEFKDYKLKKRYYCVDCNKERLLIWSIKKNRGGWIGLNKKGDRPGINGRVGPYAKTGIKRLPKHLREKIAKEKERKNRREFWIKTKNNISINPAPIIAKNLRKRIYDAVKMSNAKKELHFNEFLGCTIGEFKRYLESKFVDGMSWDNYGKKGWEIDHSIPCAYWDLTDIEQQKKCFHWSNYQPLWAKDNMSKNSYYKGVKHNYSKNHKKKCD